MFQVQNLSLSSGWKTSPFCEQKPKTKMSCMEDSLKYPKVWKLPFRRGNPSHSITSDVLNHLTISPLIVAFPMFSQALGWQLHCCIIDIATCWEQFYYPRGPVPKIPTSAGLSLWFWEFLSQRLIDLLPKRGTRKKERLSTKKGFWKKELSRSWVDLLAKKC